MQFSFEFVVFLTISIAWNWYCLKRTNLIVRQNVTHIVPCVVQGMRIREGYLFSKKRYPSLTPSQRKFPLQASSSKSCNACRIGCLLFFVSKRFGFLLSSLSLCLRLVSLTQSPSTTDFINLACACQSGIASLAAVHTIEQYTSSVAAN